MSAPYLEKLRASLNELQAQQINRLVLSRKEKGEIRDLEELRSHLSELTNKLLNEDIAPTFELFLGAAGGLIDSETWNFMLQSTRDDLETLFTQTNSLNDIIEAHHQIVSVVILRTLRKAVEELNAKVTLYEFLAHDDQGYNESHFNTFKTVNGLRSTRTVDHNELLFLDPRTALPLDTDVTFDPKSENILAGTKKDIEYIWIANVEQIFDSETDQSATIVNPENIKLSNVIDNTLGTYWVYSVMTPLINQNGVATKLKFSLGESADINFIEIDPASPYPMELERLDYIDNNDVVQSLSFDNVIINQPTRIAIQLINTAEFTLVVRQKNALDTQYLLRSKNDNFVKSVTRHGTSVVDVNSIRDELRRVISSPRLLDSVLNLSTESTETEKHYQYIVGFDNVKVGKIVYATNSVFVSAPIKSKDLTQLALKAQEQRPLVDTLGHVTYTTDTYPVTDTGQYFPCSIEYWIKLLNFNKNDQLISVESIPILPNNTERVYHEGLLLTTTGTGNTYPNIGYLMLYPDLDTITVYKDGIELTENVDWEMNSSLSNTEEPPNGLPNRVAITIVNVFPLSKYTVSYTPVFSNSRANPANLLDQTIIKSVDLKGDGSILYGASNIIFLDSYQRILKDIAKTQVHLVIILRRNTTDQYLTPIVDEYTLLLSTVDKEKFNILDV